jgi:hypothetical protein
MLRLMLCLLMLPGGVFAQAQSSADRLKAEDLKKDIESLQSAVNEVVGATVPGFGVLQSARGTYLDGYGIVVTLELALEPPRNPFMGIKSASEVRTAVGQRRRNTQEGLSKLLKQKAPAMESIAPAESGTIIVYLLNTNPADLPDLPSQIVFSVRKEDALSGSVSIREYR